MDVWWGYKAVGQAAEEEVLEGEGSEDAVIGRAMGWRRKVTNYC